jgi:hypothetical protein
MINMFISKARHDHEIDTLKQAHNGALQKAHERWSVEYHKRASEEFAHNNTKALLMVTENLFCTVRAEAFTAKQENAIMRQILEDLTGKSADELIENHRRATRILEYGVELPDLPKRPAEDEEVEE